MVIMASMLSWALLCAATASATQTSARTWRPSTAGFAFPEDEAEVLAQHLGGKDFGVALAGGGTRGLALGHGILRSLRETGQGQPGQPGQPGQDDSWFDHGLIMFDPHGVIGFSHLR